MSGFERGVGDGQERQAYAGAGAGGAAGGVDINSPSSKEIVESLLAMGISQQEADAAVQTGAETVEAAIAWVFENREQGDILDAGASDFQDYKMVFVINASLGMTAGKMAAQVGHTAIALYQDLVSRQDIYGGSLVQWTENGSKKIVLHCENADEFEQLVAKAETSGLPCTVTTDAGYTQIPSGSRTVLAVFGLVSDVDAVTGHLRLY